MSVWQIVKYATEEDKKKFEDLAYNFVLKHLIVIPCPSSIRQIERTIYCDCPESKELLQMWKQELTLEFGEDNIEGIEYNSI